MRKPTITAHSGCEGTAGGSMEAVLRGIGLGADFVEVDVRDVPGLGLALSHDTAGDPAGLVTLEAVFGKRAGHPRVGVNCAGSFDPQRATADHAQVHRAENPRQRLQDVSLPAPAGYPCKDGESYGSPLNSRFAT